MKIPEAEQDRTLPDTLRTELAGILNWALQGCLAWQRAGLGTPEDVQQATANYRADMDPVGEFLTATYVRDATQYVTASTLFEAYETWCLENRETPLSQNIFGEKLAAHGFTPDRMGHQRQCIWRGLRLKTDGERLREAARENAAASSGQAADGPEPPPPASDLAPAAPVPGPAPASAAVPQERPTSHPPTTTATTREQEPVPFLPPNLPEAFAEWPVAWREFFLMQRLALEREEGLSPQDATRQALAIARQDFRDTLMPRTVIAARVAAEMGADLQALSTRLGKDLHTLGDDERGDLQLELISLTAAWPGWSRADKDLLDIYFTRFHLEWNRQYVIRMEQRWQAYCQRPDRYGTLPVSPRFPNSWMEWEACRYDLDLANLSTRLGVNLCNLTTLEEVVALQNRLLYGDAHDLVTEQEGRGLYWVILAYKQALEPKKPKKPKKPTGPPKKR